MNLQETGQLFELIGTYNDQFGAGLDEKKRYAKVVAWQELLNDYTYTDCLNAVKDFYTHDETPWIMPAHIINRVKDVQRKRLEQFGGFMPLNKNDEFNPDGTVQNDYRAKIQHLHTLAKNGQIALAQYRAYQDNKISITELTTQHKEITQ